MTCASERLTDERVLAALRSLWPQPVTASELLYTMPDVPWAARGTLRNRLYALVDCGVVLCDEGRPMRFAVREAS